MNISRKHLTPNEREIIMLMHSHGKKQYEIARAIGRSESTISRELRRHSLATYSAVNAQQSYETYCKQIKLSQNYIQ